VRLSQPGRAGARQATRAYAQAPETPGDDRRGPAPGPPTPGPGPATAKSAWEEAR